jgi:dipeptidyl aminopeptidase/acylaminoacyl peptidase
MRVSGGEAEQITWGKSGVSAFKWSPDGTRIAYTMSDPETKEEKKSKLEKRHVILVNRQFKFNRLHIIPLSKDEKGKRKSRQITSGRLHVATFDWSPDGKTIAFAHQPDPRINTGFGAGIQDISVVSANGGVILTLVNWPGADNNPRYSPDGRWIAFTSHGGSVESVGISDVFVIPASGGLPRKLAETPDRNAGIIDWSSNGKEVFITESYRTMRRVYAVPVDGKKVVVVTDSDGVIGSVAFDKATDRMAFTYQTPDMPVDVFTSHVRSLKKERLTDIHKGLPRPPMGRTEAIKWKSFDGREIEGLLTYPVGYQKGERYPLILNIHGGPAGMFDRRFTGSAGIYMIQAFAQRGYAVLRPNPRGSTGYGKEFRYANVQDWGYGDYEDVMSGVDAVIKTGVADPDKMAVMGWSYGGYLTSFLVTRTNRFKAASVGAGLPNLISMQLTNDIPGYLTAHFGGEPWDDYTRYEKHSAIYRVKNVKTPSQILHGERDRRVPTSQGYEFYNALDRLGVPTEMVVYPRTPHGPREPKLLMDVTPRILLWFERHVLGKNEVVAKKAEKDLPR